ncbi:hypothetical protein Pla163_34450 [Planctomycetes bacterium Pla163]|uniref:Uncharacterized protein n=1 Tax=Rohdeia mirabilis TaxID=2528008 RepID=A0A518D4A5_9BACT|nr:hypothetical protein Pla163_34450 [Planctomycetes bacterium Pla163]
MLPFALLFAALEPHLLLPVAPFEIEPFADEPPALEQAAEPAPLGHVSRVPLAPVSPGLGAALRGSTSFLRPERFEFDLRLVEGIDAERSRIGLVATYALTERLTVGVEASPKKGEVGPLALYRVQDETADRPAVVVGTSSDRIGTPQGRAFWVTASKSLEPQLDFPLAPYVGLAWGDFEDEFEVLAGVRIDWSRGISTTSLWDGENLHHQLEFEWESGWRVGVLAIEDDEDGRTRFGLSLGAALGAQGR